MKKCCIFYYGIHVWNALCNDPHPASVEYSGGPWLICVFDESKQQFGLAILGENLGFTYGTTGEPDPLPCGCGNYVYDNHHGALMRSF